MTMRGRADLVRLIIRLGEKKAATLCRLFGYDYEAPSDDIVRTTTPSPSEPGPTDAADESDLHQELPLSFYCAVHYSGVIKESECTARLQEDKPGYTPRHELFYQKLSNEKQPDQPLLAPWPRLERRIDRLLSAPCNSHRVDVATLISLIAGRKYIRKIPRIQVTRWPRRLAVIIDRSRRLTPFFYDQYFVYHKLKERIGKSNICEFRVFDGGIVVPVPMSMRGDSDHSLFSSDSMRVLVLGDCGTLSASSALVNEWNLLARAFNVHRKPCSVLTPAPTERRCGLSVAQWKTESWEERCGKGILSSGELESRAYRLLALLSPALRVEPGLLRMVRNLLPHGCADSGTEADVWRHHLLSSSAPVAMTIDPSARADLRSTFGMEDAALRVAVLRTIRRWHSILPKEIWYEELLKCRDADKEEFGSELAEAKKHLRSLAVEVRRSVTGTGGAATGNLLDYWNRFENRTKDDAVFWNVDDAYLGKDFRETWAVVHRDDVSAIAPAGVQLSDETIFGPSDYKRQFIVDKVQNRLLITGSLQDHASSRFPICCIDATRPEVKVITSRSGCISGQRFIIDQKNHSVDIPVSDIQNLQIETDQGTMFITQITKPRWAEEIGRDQYGLYVDIEIMGARQRMRWINPGRFIMGSPENEEGRSDDEKQHEVILTTGYWLFDTPVTQAMWTAVMGKNPSRFQSQDRPVENISWKDCDKFIRCINEILPELALRLPTEAQWEYACRAGSTTATYAGEMKILGENNAPILEEIAWYGGNSGVDFELENGIVTSSWNEKQYDHKTAGTHPVGKKQPNKWGLYDMIGNIWEWCGDWYEKHSDNIVTDPQGPEIGRRRVLRGGSWFDNVRNYRSACRSWGLSSFRDAVGFRLSRCQEQAEEQEIARDGVLDGSESRKTRADAAERTVPELLLYKWHKRHGRDTYGIWLDFSYKDAVQRMRWITPGTFMMGSPEEEPERMTNETLHGVTISKGFWLADTACTQELWEAVMGENPSRFKGPQRPVEMVSWDDCQLFLKKINLMPDLVGIDLCLPTEAQWEYACRAGTTTPFSFGENITPEQVNYNGNYPYVGGVNGLYREVTVAVKTFAPNGWGLYEMHGNVWEWCNDWYSGYPSGRVTDPQGPETGKSRVLHGGSCFYFARGCRSAYRNWSDSGYRFGNFGFRFSRGQEHKAERRERVR